MAEFSACRSTSRPVKGLTHAAPPRVRGAALAHPAHLSLSNPDSGANSRALDTFPARRRPAAVRMVLDALILIKSQRVDSSLTFPPARVAKASAGSCAMNIKRRQLPRLPPLPRRDLPARRSASTRCPHLPVVKDLVPDLTNFLRRSMRFREGPGLQTRTPVPADRERLQIQTGRQERIETARAACNPVRRGLLDRLPELLVETASAFPWVRRGAASPPIAGIHRQPADEATRKSGWMSSKDPLPACYRCPHPIMNCNRRVPGRNLNPARAIARDQGKCWSKRHS